MLYVSYLENCTLAFFPHSVPVWIYKTVQLYMQRVNYKVIWLFIHCIKKKGNKILNKLNANYDFGKFKKILPQEEPYIVTCWNTVLIRYDIFFIFNSSHSNLYYIRLSFKIQFNFKRNLIPNKSYRDMN